MEEVERLKRNRRACPQPLKIRQIILRQNGTPCRASYLVNLLPQEVVQDENRNTQ